MDLFTDLADSEFFSLKNNNLKNKVNLAQSAPLDDIHKNLTSQETFQLNWCSGLNMKHLLCFAGCWR